MVAKFDSVNREILIEAIKERDKGGSGGKVHKVAKRNSKQGKGRRKVERKILDRKRGETKMFTKLDTFHTAIGGSE
ncbi:hypothetical protein PUN28_003630 [Cardiocondyla obscurior]|uniref:Uncharacterized protein n=1 Tax=Cardiocondyla obscurior TaxID=286306 RepID=A0AAW2GP50_9HYME